MHPLDGQRDVPHQLLSADGDRLDQRLGALLPKHLVQDQRQRSQEGRIGLVVPGGVMRRDGRVGATNGHATTVRGKRGICAHPFG